MTSLTPNFSGPAKYPLREVAVILCSRCRERYQLSLVASHGHGVELLTCPRCHSTIPVYTIGDVVTVKPDRGHIAGQYLIPFIPMNQLHHQPTT